MSSIGSVSSIFSESQKETERANRTELVAERRKEKRQEEESLIVEQDSLSALKERADLKAQFDEMVDEMETLDSDLGEGEKNSDSRHLDVEA